MSWKGGITKNLICQWCKVKFDADRSNKKYCSKKCYTEWQKGKLAYPNVVGKRGIKPRYYHLRKRARQGGAEYSDWRKSVFERDGWTCQFCGERGGRLNADHIKPYAKYPELRYEISNGRTLCVDCHKTTDSYGWQNYWNNYKKTDIAEERLRH